MGQPRDITEKDVDRALQRFFYGKIIDALYQAQDELVQEEHYEAAQKVQNKIHELEIEFNIKSK